jgi:hypothetical protein
VQRKNIEDFGFLGFLSSGRTEMIELFVPLQSCCQGHLKKKNEISSLQISKGGEQENDVQQCSSFR